MTSDFASLFDDRSKNNCLISNNCLIRMYDILPTQLNQKTHKHLSHKLSPYSKKTART